MNRVCLGSAFAIMDLIAPAVPVKTEALLSILAQQAARYTGESGA